MFDDFERDAPKYVTTAVDPRTASCYRVSWAAPLLDGPKNYFDVRSKLTSFRPDLTVCVNVDFALYFAGNVSGCVSILCVTRLSSIQAVLIDTLCSPTKAPICPPT
jgi:hypothetical protein